MKNPTPQRRIPGLFRDKDGHAYFYQAKTRTAFFISDAEVKTAEVVAYRVWIALAAGVVLYSIFPTSPWYPVAAGILLYASLEWFYRKRLLGRARKVSPYLKVTSRQSEMDAQATNILWIKGIGYLVLAGLLAVTIVTQKNEGVSLAILIAMIAIAAISGFQNLYILYKRAR